MIILLFLLRTRRFTLSTIKCEFSFQATDHCTSPRQFHPIVFSAS